MAFLKKEIKFILKYFWPHRSNPKGFSIENLARRYHEKISSVSSNRISNQLLDNSNLKSAKEDNKNLSLSHFSSKRIHWANRDFSEYREVA